MRDALAEDRLEVDVPHARQQTFTDPAIRGVAVLAVTGLAGLAGYVSYLHMLTLAHRSGIEGVDAHSFPIMVDGLDLIGGIVLLADRRTGRRSGLLPWGVLGTGAVASIVANIAVAPNNLVARAISGWTAVALLAAAKMLSHLFEPIPAGAQTPPEAAPAAVAPNMATAPAPPTAPDTRSSTASGNPKRRRRRAVDVARRLPTGERALARWRRIWLATRHLEAATTDVAQEHGVSLRTLQFIRAAGDQGHLDTPPDVLPTAGPDAPAAPATTRAAPAGQRPVHRHRWLTACHRQLTRPAPHSPSSQEPTVWRKPMSGKAAAGLTALALAIVTYVAALGLAGGGLAMAACVAPNAAASPATTAHSAWPAVGDWTTEQVNNAAVIVAVGRNLQVPPRGWVVAVATAMQESGLRNLGYLGPDNDHDSLGLFQQRPSQGWGTPAQLLDPTYAATLFYNRLLDVPNWQKLPLTVAAQKVQRSATPTAYSKWENDAHLLVSHVGSAAGTAIPVDLGRCVSICSSVAAVDSGSCIEASTIFGRAQSWLTAWAGGPVPYLSSGNPEDWFQGYRRDCSGYVSMALGLPGPGLNTSGLAARSAIISKLDLRPGDLLINTAPDLRGHVVLFERWVDAAMTRYYGYEQSGSGGTHYRIIPYSYFAEYSMTPYRLRTISGE